MCLPSEPETRGVKMGRVERERGAERDRDGGGGILYYTRIKLKHKLALLQLCP